MKILLSLPPNLVECFHDITGVSHEEWFCTNDPIGSKLGSGGGTTWAIQEAYRTGFMQEGERCIILHAGGQSRRLPSYAPSGKILTPIPVFRWKRGQRLSQNLLDLQLPLYRQMLEKAPSKLTTMIVSGDVYVRANAPLQAIPDADVVCYGLWVDASLAKNHGVFVSRRDCNTEQLEFMLQKPSIETLNKLMQDHLFLMDIGVWMLSDKAMRLLMERSMGGKIGKEVKASDINFYDLYSDFGLALGNNPRIVDKELNELKVAILPLPEGEFHHYGTSREMISSTLAIQNRVIDQREIMKKGTKVHPDLFVQNADVQISFTSDNSEIWIENSCVGEKWKISNRNIITGVPKNDWSLSLSPEQCIDVVPYGETQYIARPYGFNDTFAGELQSTPLFPIIDDVDQLGDVLDWMIGNKENKKGGEIFEKARKMSAEEISSYANLRRLEAQRRAFRAENWPILAENHDRSVFYQVNLKHAAEEFKAYNIAMPKPLDESADRLRRISDAMFRNRITGEQKYEDEAFALMREGLTAIAREAQTPKLSVYADQIVWSRSPVRIDLAGGWTDTPPISLMEGGNVVNLAIELNGQPPLQVYVKPSNEFCVTLRSIDLGAVEKVHSFEELRAFNKVGSPFSIPKAALALAGFLPDFCVYKYLTLEDQLKEFGAGIEMTMLSAIPAGSGLGTSSILASTVLGAVNDFCGLGWDKYDICNRTLVLEQLLTTGGGWQDQYGGALHGIKLLQTQPGWQQQPLVRWLPNNLFTAPEYAKLHLLYYTGITRTAKGILAEIVRGMFLNSTEHLEVLEQMKIHALDIHDAIQRNDFDAMGRLIRKTWSQNQILDSGTNPPAVKAITDRIDDLCLGYKLPGAGGGGYLYMVAKDEDAASRIKRLLTAEPANQKARFVEMTLSHKGLEISKS
ncbi:MAG: bifunctional fucokinase/L-fucose-1-P-guanylyltransferase [Bacteroidales bacterium]|nr:bifunctional fucokinase/L-fucose-1-P-guanylyltransferase [Bacteroidales bacterium]